MFTNLNKKIVAGILTLSFVLSGLAVMPTFAFAKENNENGHGGGKNNFGKAVKTWAHFKNDDDSGLGIGKILSDDIFSTTSPSSFRVFKQEIKDARADKKEANKDARKQLKTDIKEADTPEEKTTAVKTFLNSILSAFRAFAAAKEAALAKLISSL